jgi:hypothetical protein
MKNDLDSPLVLAVLVFDIAGDTTKALVIGSNHSPECARVVIGLELEALTESVLSDHRAAALAKETEAVASHFREKRLFGAIPIVAAATDSRRKKRIVSDSFRLKSLACSPSVILLFLDRRRRSFSSQGDRWRKFLRDGRGGPGRIVDGTSLISSRLVGAQSLSLSSTPAP